MTEKFDGNYSIQNLQESLREVMAGEYTPHEIHEVILDTVKDNMRYYRACYNDSVKLLSLLEIGSVKDVKLADRKYTESDYWDGKLSGKDFEDALKKYGFDYTPIDKKFKLDSPELHNEDEN